VTLQAVALALAVILGAPPELARTTADEVARAGGDEQLLAEALVWEEHESRFGRALSGRRWDARASGILQVRDRPELERDARGSVRAWLGLLHAGEQACGTRTGGLQALSSGHCGWAVTLVASRQAEAAEALYWAGVALSAAEQPWGR